MVGKFTLYFPYILLIAALVLTGIERFFNKIFKSNIQVPVPCILIMQLLSCQLSVLSRSLFLFDCLTKGCITQVDGFYSLLLTAKRLDTEVRPDNGADVKEAMAKRLTMAKTKTPVAKSVPSLHVTVRGGHPCLIIDSSMPAGWRTFVSPGSQ